MEILTSVILICVAIMFYVLIRILRGMERLKRQNDIIYENKFEENRLMDKCQEIAEEMYPKSYSDNNIPYDFEFESNHIKELSMSIRLFRCLRAAKIEYIEQVQKYSKKELLSFRNFGKKSMFELKELMNEYGLKFKE